MTVRRVLAAFCGCWLFAATAAAQTPASADATSLLLMTRDIQVASDGTSVQTLHVEIRANNDAGVAGLGQVAFTYDNQTQKADISEAYTRKANGSTVPVAASAIYEQPPAAIANIVTSLRNKIILFPQLRAGDTIVYTIKLEDQPKFPGQFIEAELFNPAVTYDDVRETITAPKSMNLAVENHQVEFSKKDVGAQTQYSWHYAAVHPADAQPQSTVSPMARMPRFFISSEKDYAALGRAYATAQQQKRVPTAQVTTLAEKITAGTRDRRQQAEEIYDWVSSNIRYVAIELGTGSFIPHDADSIIANGYGDCKDHDVLLGALLKAKGIDSIPVLINGDTEYALSDVPTYTGIDHVITYVPEFSVYLDSTAALASFGVLPLVEYGKPIIVASPGGAALGQVPVLVSGVAKISVVAQSVMDKDGIVATTTTTTASGPYAITLRAVGLAIQGLGSAAAKKLLAVQGDADADGSFTQDSPLAQTPSFAITGTMKTSSLKEYLSGANSFDMPAGMRLLDASGDGVMGPFNRGGVADSDPILCFSAETTQDLSLKAPPGILFGHAPKDVNVQTPELTFTARWTLNGDTMRVQRHFVSKIGQPLCSGDLGVRTAAAIKSIADSFDKSAVFFQTQEKSTTAPLFESGRQHMAAQEYAAAFADYDKIVSQAPDDANGLYDRALANKALKHYDDALADMNKAISIGSNDAEFYNERGIVLGAMGQAEKSLEDFSKAVVLSGDTGNARFYANRGLAYLQLLNFPLAQEDFDKAITLSAKSTNDVAIRAGAYAGRSLVLEKLHQYEAAIQDLDKAIILDPGNARWWLRRGMLKNQSRRGGAGTADVNKALQLDPKILQ